ncbi:MAG: hypothetical protein V9E99_10855 [Microthrixaceae bacterium]
MFATFGVPSGWTESPYRIHQRGITEPSECPITSTWRAPVAARTRSTNGPNSSIDERRMSAIPPKIEPGAAP